MKTRIIIITAFILVFSAMSFAQVKVVPKTVTYQRPKSIEQEFKRSFGITYPKIVAPNGAKIESILNYEKSFDFKLSEQTKGEDLWLDSCTFSINYNKNNILDVTLSMEGSGAYPSTSTKYVVVNSKTATRVKPSDVFSKQDDLAALIKKAQKIETKKAIAGYKKDPDAAGVTDMTNFGNVDFKAENLWSFTVSDKGITFHYDYGFPHAILALQPDGDCFYTWAQLKPFIKTDGLFAQFVR